MATNLLSAAMSYLTPDVVQNISSLVGESPATTQKAVEGALPSLLAGLTNFASSGNGATRLVNLLNQGNYGNLLTNLPNLVSGGNATENLLSSGRNILSMVFGGKLNSVIDLIAGASGVKSASASSLLSLLAPLVLGILGKEKAAQGLGTAGLTSLLMGQKDQIVRLAPKGLADIFGLSSLTNLGSQFAGAATRLTSNATTQIDGETIRREGSPWRWLLPALGLLALAVFYSLWGGGTSVERETLASPTVARVSLPNGRTLSLQEDSLNYTLAKFLADTTDTTVPKTFTFDNLNFETGTTQLTLESEQAVNNLIDILKAYPAVAVRLEGHTDSTGDSEDNKRLSLVRAEAVKERVVKEGIDVSRITTAGYGQEKPLASNETEDGQAKNRRLELVVVKR